MDKSIQVIAETMYDMLDNAGIDVNLIDRRIYFYNGRNGTLFDWEVNDHIPFFKIFYDKSKTGHEYAAISVMIDKYGAMRGFAYKHDNVQDAIQIQPRYLFTMEDAEKLARHLNWAFDELDRYDCPLFGDVK